MLSLSRIFAPLFRRGRRRAAVEAPAAPTPGATPVSSSEMSATDVLREAIERVGGAPACIEEDRWLGIAETVLAEIDAAPPPPPTSLPAFASRLLALVRQPDVDVNELVGAVQRDAAIATALLRVANSAAFQPPVPVTTLRAAIQLLGTRQVAEVVVAIAGRALFEAPSRDEFQRFPTMWPTMFRDAMANACTAGWLALEVRGARTDRAFLAGLLVDLGRPVALRMVAALIRERRLDRPDDETVLAVLDEVAPVVGARAIRSLGLPDELRDACVPASPDLSTEAHLGRIVGGVGAIQRRSPRAFSAAGRVRESAAHLAIAPLFLRTLFAQRQQYVEYAAKMIA